MDILQNGCEAWQVIPLFFIGYIAIGLLFSGGAQLSWISYREYHLNVTDTVHFRVWTHPWMLLYPGVSMFLLATIGAIVGCFIVPMIRKRRRVPDTFLPENGEAEGEVKTWVASSTSDMREVQGLTESTPTVQYRYPVLDCSSGYLFW